MLLLFDDAKVQFLIVDHNRPAAMVYRIIVYM